MYVHGCPIIYNNPLEKRSVLLERLRELTSFIKGKKLTLLSLTLRDSLHYDAGISPFRHLRKEIVAFGLDHSAAQLSHNLTPQCLACD
jgi:hypothetical protein